MKVRKGNIRAHHFLLPVPQSIAVVEVGIKQTHRKKSCIYLAIYRYQYHALLIHLELIQALYFSIIA